MLDRRQQTGYFRLWQGMIASRRQRALEAAQPTSKGPKDDGQGVAGGPAVMGGGRRRFYWRLKQGRDFFPQILIRSISLRLISSEVRS